MAVVASVAAGAVQVERAIVGKRLLLIETLKGLSGPGLPSRLLDGSRRRGPEFLQKTG